MSKEQYRRERLTAAYKALKPCYQEIFGRLFVQIAVRNHDAAALELAGSTWLATAEQTLQQLHISIASTEPLHTDGEPVGMRSAIRSAMAHLFPKSIELALEPWAASEKNKLEAATWLKLYEYRKSVETLLKDAPGMLPVWYWFALRYPTLAGEEPLHALSQNISASIRPASWRRLLRLPWPVLLRYCPARPEGKFDQLIDFLEFIDAIELPSVEKAERLVFLHDALTSAGCKVFNSQTVQHFLPLPWIRELILTSNDTMVSDVGIYTVLCWYRDSGDAMPASGSKISWKNLYEAARKWSRERELILAASDCSWDSDVNESLIGNFRIVPLISEASLIEEGCRMNHCVANYTDDCANGDYRIFSVRLADSGKRIATFSIVFDPDYGWSVGMVNGYANTDVSQPIHDLANFFAYAYERS